MNFVQWLGFISLILCLAVLWQIRQLLLLIFAAIVVANALNHLANWFQSKNIKRGYAIALSVSLLILVLGLFGWLIIPPFIPQFQELLTLLPQGINRFIIWLKSLIANLDPQLIHALPNLQQLTQQLQPVISQIAGQGLSIFYSTLGLPLSLLLLLALSLMLLADPQSYRQGFIRLFPAFYRSRIDQVLSLCEESLENWLVGSLLTMGVIASGSFIGLLLLGIPVPLAQALLAGLLAFIPYIGSLLAVILPMAIALLESPWKSVVVLILYLIIQQLEIQIITPKIMGKSTHVLPGITLLAQLFFASFFGFLGLFLAYPLSVVGRVIFKEIFVKDILDNLQPASIGLPFVKTVKIPEEDAASSGEIRFDNLEIDDK
ncbi:MAG: AI-2E family transporter [Snowella sp.]|nr:AI-2E family transporter [Snowella sp.]